MRHCQVCARPPGLPATQQKKSSNSPLLLKRSSPTSFFISVEPHLASDLTCIFTHLGSEPAHSSSPSPPPPPFLPIPPLCCTAMRGPTSKTCALAATWALNGCNLGASRLQLRPLASRRGRCRGDKGGAECRWHLGSENPRGVILDRYFSREEQSVDGIWRVGDMHRLRHIPDPQWLRSMLPGAFVVLLV